MRNGADHVAVLNPPIHFDTCTAAGAGGCRSLWGDSRTIVDCVVAIGSPARQLAFAGLMRARDAYPRAVHPSAAPATPPHSPISAPTCAPPPRSPRHRLPTADTLTRSPHRPTPAPPRA